MTGPAAGRPAAHAARPSIPPARVIGWAVAALAILGVAGLGTASCLSTLEPATSTPTSARSITVTPVPGP